VAALQMNLTKIKIKIQQDNKYKEVGITDMGVKLCSLL